MQLARNGRTSDSLDCNDLPDGLQIVSFEVFFSIDAPLFIVVEEVAMKNTELFRFRFVDRTSERATLLKFLNLELPSNILWINGPSGVGKTFFIQKNVLDSKEKGDVVVYLNKMQEVTTSSYLTQFIKELSDTSKISFVEFIRANYISIFDIAKKVAVKTLTNNSIEDFGLMDGSLDLTKQFLTSNSKERHSLIKVIDRYLKYVSKKSKALIILDNFTYCDEESLDILSSVFHSHQGDKQLQFILVTTQEELQKRFDILTLLSEKIDVVRISLKPFASSSYFFDILNNLFDLCQCQQEDIHRLYQVCKGLPQKLKIFLMTLYSQDGINYQNEKATFVYDKMLQLLRRELITFDFDGLPTEQKYILWLVTEWGQPIEVAILQSLTEYVANTDISFQEFTGSIFRRALLGLENLDILEKVYEADTCQIKIKHDSIYYAVCQLLRENSVKSRFIHFSMFHFLKINWDHFKPDERNALEAYHSFLAKTDNWYQSNVNFGLILAGRKQYIRAQKVLDRLSEHIQKLPTKQQLAIALNAYNAGEFEKANSILNLVPSENITSQEKFLLQSTQCRIAMMQMDYPRALSTVNRLLDSGLDLSTEQRLEALYLKEVALCLIPQGYTKAKHLFREIVQNFNSEDAPFWMERIYRTAMDYYCGDTSKRYLQQAQAVSRELSDDEELAKSTHNLGFEHFRCGEYQDAMDCFQKGRNILEGIKPHEISYSLNNIAVIYMVKNEYGQALEILEEASFWNRSNYAKIAIKGNQMICHHYESNLEEEKRIEKELIRFLKEEPLIDDKIYKKIYTNLSIIYMNRQNNEQALVFLKQCLPYLKQEMPHSSARVKKLLNMLGDMDGQNIHLNHYRDYYYNLPFEPWVLTFGNE